MALIDGQDYVVRLIALPHHIRAFTAVDTDGLHNIYINLALPDNARISSFRHELRHIQRNDFYSRTDIRVVEQGNK